MYMYFVYTQVAGCTLDASAKIYAGRVDSIYNDAFKMLGGLGWNDFQDQGIWEEVCSMLMKQ